ncbi:hypothetical protein DH2020_004348 [Rehmannia glutinosa]|uniref:Galactinol--sucrose galactosyltransferase n=1 Tax=Rehmannia glutinosa TaxID=99300 RepID=A0ABR0XP81_REHGL
METQLILLQVPELNSYVLILPLIEKSFRSAIHPGRDGEIILCIASGSTKVKASSFTSCVYLHIGENPYDLMRDAFAAIRVHLGTFRLLEEKIPPKIIDRFGWCTWDAFYLTVEPVGVWHGIKTLTENGVPPKFLIIDDGWQSVNMDHEDPFRDSKDLIGLGSQMLCRLYRFQENEKFAKYQAGTMLKQNAPQFDQEKHDKMFKEMIELEKTKKALKEANEDDYISLPEGNVIEYLREEDGVERGGLKALISDLKKQFTNLEDVYVWHALCGAWGGVRPGTTHLKTEITPAKMADGLEKTMYDLAVVMVEKGGIGLVDPKQAEDLYEAMHSYLADAGVTGVKVDVIHTLEYVCEDHGGRVELAKAYYDGLTKSLRKNFNGSGLIASMEQCNDFFFLATNQISMGRVMTSGSRTQMATRWEFIGYKGFSWSTAVITACGRANSFNLIGICSNQIIFVLSSMLVHELSVVDVYVSDKVGRHNFDLLRKLVLPDGTILRCQHYALPTRDCLFENPLFDGTTLLKLWNLNKNSHIKKFKAIVEELKSHENSNLPQSDIFGEVVYTIHIGQDDITYDKDFTAQFRKNELFAVYLHKAGNLHLMKGCDKMDITLQPSSFEIFTISPVYEFSENARFAAIGLENMFNSGGAVESLEQKLDGKSVGFVIKIKGAGKFLACSSIEPLQVMLNNESIKFEWTSDGLLKFEVPWTGGELSDATILISI